MRDRNAAAINEHIGLPNIYKMKLKNKIVNRLKKIRIFRVIKNKLESIVTLLRGLILSHIVYVYQTSKQDAGNIAKTMTPNGKQFTITREMLTAVARK